MELTQLMTELDSALLQKAMPEENQRPTFTFESLACMRNQAIKAHQSTPSADISISVDEVATREVTQQEQQAVSQVVNILMSFGDGIVVERNARQPQVIGGDLDTALNQVHGGTDELAGMAVQRVHRCDAVLACQA